MMTSRFAGRFVSAHAVNPAKEPISVWEQRWVLPHPTASIKVLKWVKTNKTRAFPEEEDACYVYSEATNAAAQAQAYTATATASEAGTAPTTTSEAVTSNNAASDAQGPSIGDAVIIDSSKAAMAARVVAVASVLDARATGLNAESRTGVDTDETQGDHLFDEMQADIEMSIAGDSTRIGTTKPPTAAGTAAQGTSVSPALAEESVVAPTVPAADIEVEVAEGEEGEGEEDAEEEPIHFDKHQTIRIGGPLPEGLAELPLDAEASAAAAAPAGERTRARASKGPADDSLENSTFEDAGPTPQVEIELHPPPDGVLAAPAPPAVTDSTTSAPAGEAQVGGNGNAKPVTVGGVDDLGGVQETKSKDSEV